MGVQLDIDKAKRNAKLRKRKRIDRGENTGGIKNRGTRIRKSKKIYSRKEMSWLEVLNENS